MTPKSVEGSEYPDDWKAIAADVKNSAAWRCVRCGHKHDPEAGYALTVHHLDMDRSNCRWWNLAALCQRCHLHIQAKVVMHQPYMFEHSRWFRPYVAGYYAHQQGECDSLGAVRKHLERLLAYGRVSV